MIDPRRIAIAAIALAGCGGATPEVVGARPSDVAVVDLQPAIPVAVATAAPSAEPEIAPAERAEPEETRFGKLIAPGDEPTFGMGTLGLGGDGLGKGFGSAKIPFDKAPPRIRAATADVTGSLPKEVIQRIVRQNFGRFRLCYEKGLEHNAKLGGQVITRFVIGKDGAVVSSTNAGSTVPDANVVACVVRAFATISFPNPDGGVVVVVYPLTFTPGDDAPATAGAAGSAMPTPKPSP